MNKKLLIMTAFFFFSPLFNVVGVSQTPPYYDYNNPTPQAVFAHHLWMDYRQYLGRSHERARREKAWKASYDYLASHQNLIPSDEDMTYISIPFQNGLPHANRVLIDLKSLAAERRVTK